MDKEGSESESERFEDARLRVLKTEDRAGNHGMWVAKKPEVRKPFLL